VDRRDGGGGHFPPRLTRRRGVPTPPVLGIELGASALGSGARWWVAGPGFPSFFGEGSSRPPWRLPQGGYTPTVTALDLSLGGWGWVVCGWIWRAPRRSDV
jgi:hypothetical protein